MDYRDYQSRYGQDAEEQGRPELYPGPHGYEEDPPDQDGSPREVPPSVEGESGIQDLVGVVLRGILLGHQALLYAATGADLVTGPVSADELALWVVLLAYPACRHMARAEPPIAAPSRLRSILEGLVDE